jgi:hypothetical protein
VNKHFSILAEARPVRAAAKVWSLALLGLLTVQQAHAQAAAAGGAANTLGGRMQAASSDLTVGGGYILQILGYLLGGAAVLSGVYAIWQHTKNPNGQGKLGYGFVSVLAGGAFLAASLFASYSSQTLAGAGPTNTGTAAQMTFN